MRLDRRTAALMAATALVTYAVAGWAPRPGALLASRVLAKKPLSKRSHLLFYPGVPFEIKLNAKKSDNINNDVTRWTVTCMYNSSSGMTPWNFVSGSAAIEDDGTSRKKIRLRFMPQVREKKIRGGTGDLLIVIDDGAGSQFTTEGSNPDVEQMDENPCVK